MDILLKPDEYRNMGLPGKYFSHKWNLVSDVPSQRVGDPEFYRGIFEDMTQWEPSGDSVMYKSRPSFATKTLYQILPGTVQMTKSANDLREVLLDMFKLMERMD